MSEYSTKVKFVDVPIGEQFKITKSKKDCRVFEKQKDLSALQLTDIYGMDRRPREFYMYPYIDMPVYVWN